MSTTGVYGDRSGAFVDETAQPAPITERARRRVDSERRVRARPWRAEMSLERMKDQLFEYACHEGNYALVDIMRGVRATEAKTTK